MKITEKLLLDNFFGITPGGSKCSIISGEDIYWEYRTGRDSEGFNPVTERNNASEITLEYSRYATIQLDEEGESHPAQECIKKAYEELFGSELG